MSLAIETIAAARVDQIAILRRCADTAAAITAHRRAAALGLALILLEGQHAGGLATELAINLGLVRHLHTVALHVRREAGCHIDVIIRANRLCAKRAWDQIVLEGLGRLLALAVKVRCLVELVARP